jgi:hypothetical protein
MKSTNDAKRKAKELREARPPIDGLTVAWTTTLITAVACELGAIGARAFVRFVLPEATLLGMLSGLMLFAAAVIGTVLLVLTPIIVYRKRSNPPMGVVFFAYVVGVVPWLGMLLQARE